jgi:lipoate-protein ligase A
MQEKESAAGFVGLAAGMRLPPCRYADTEGSRENPAAVGSAPSPLASSVGPIRLRSPPMETWRLITTWGADPGFNMGLDEALLEGGENPPTVRFYSWSPDTLSLGYFQRLADVPGAERAGALVRRITGGGAIHHTGELTFSLSAPLGHPLYRGPVAESYARVHAAVIAALGAIGIAAELCGARDLASDREGTGMCFHASTPLDIVWNARKGVGSAQRRRGGRVLHHGSIKLASSPLEGAIATIGESAPGVDLAALAAVLRETFESALGISLESGVPSPAERLRARELGRRYLEREFVERR